MARPQIPCPHCSKSIGTVASEGGTLLRLRPVVVSDEGDIRGGCPHCKADVIVASGATLSKALAVPTARMPRFVLRVNTSET